MARLAWLLFRRQFWLPAFLVGAASLAAEYRLLRWPLAEWVQTSAAVHNSVVLAGPVAVAASCLVAVRLGSRSNLLAATHAVRTGRSLPLLHIGMLVALMVSAQLLALSPLLVDTARRARWGGPDWMGIALGVAALAGFASLGYFLGLLFPSLLLPPVLAVLVFVGIQVPAVYRDLGWQLLSPMNHRAPFLGQHENPVALLLQVGLYVTLVVAATCGACLLWRNRRTDTRWPSGTALTAFALPVVTVSALVLFALVPRSLEDTERPGRCERIAGAELCLHVGHSGAVPEFRTVLHQARELSAGRGRFPARLVDGALMGWAQRQAQDHEVLVFDVWPDGGNVDSLSHRLAGWVAGECPRGSRTKITEHEELAEGIREWFRAETGGSPQQLEGGGAVLRDRLTALSPEQAGRWLERHERKIADCELTRADLP